MTNTAALKSSASRYIARAAKHDIELTFSDFTVVGGELYIDGMAPGEWISAMVMD